MKQTGYTYDLGPQGVQYNSEYVPPVLLEEPDTIRDRLRVRALFASEYFFSSDRAGADWIAERLSNWATGGRTGPPDAYVQHAESDLVELLCEYGMTVSEGPCGIWHTVSGYESAIEAAQDAADEE